MTKPLRKYGMTFTQPGQTQQHQKDETDINKIMKRFIKTGVIDHINNHQAHYGENTALDYQQSLDIIIHAEQMFSELPAKARKEFNNDPAQFLEFVNEPANIPKLYDLGLSNSPHVPTPPISVPDAASTVSKDAPTTTTNTKK